MTRRVELFEPVHLICATCAREREVRESLTLGIIGPRTCELCSGRMEPVEVVVVSELPPHARRPI